VSNAATQVRLAHETNTARAFAAIQQKLACPATLVTFDYGEPGEFSSVAFKTALPLPLLVSSVEALFESWRQPGPRVIDIAEAIRVGLPGAGELVALGNEAGAAIGEGRGYALIIGAGSATQYIATGAREDMVRLFENELLPEWRKA
jgi:hypothetical protein